MRHPERVRLSRRNKARAWYRANPEIGKERAKNYRKQLRKQFLLEYGGQCICCGEQEPAFLTLEHKKRDGAKHRKLVGNNSVSVLEDLKRRGWPKDDYTILCFNCNRASYSEGVCPHQNGVNVQ